MWRFGLARLTFAGVPKAGFGYTQGLVDGMKIVIQVDGSAYESTLTATDPRVLCVRGRPA